MNAVYLRFQGLLLHQLRGRGTLDRHLHKVFAEYQIALLDLRHLVQHALAHARLVDLLGHVT